MRVNYERKATLQEMLRENIRKSGKVPAVSDPLSDLFGEGRLKYTTRTVHANRREALAVHNPVWPAELTDNLKRAAVMLGMLASCLSMINHGFDPTGSILGTLVALCVYLRGASGDIPWSWAFTFFLVFAIGILGGPQNPRERDTRLAQHWVDGRNVRP
jgi:hypothetical protein